ncbi:MAG: transposase [Ignavibacteriae bacterium]|nr:transposase [Ignavibacteriota bacterium]
MQKRRHDSGDEKVSILRRHLVERVPVSDLCEHYHISPAVFYRWQKEFFEKGGSVFQSSLSSNQGSEKRIVVLETKLVQKNEVLAELMAEHLKLKKTLGVL